MNKRTRRKCTTFCGTLQIEIPVIFIRDRMGGESGGAQNPNKASQFHPTRCISNCYQKYCGAVKWNKFKSL